MTQEMNLITEKKGEVMHFKITGDIDHHNAKKIKNLIDSELFISRPAEMILDLSEVEFMDSSGLGLIMGRYKTATELGIDFKLLNPNEQVMKILCVAGCDKIMTIKTKGKKEQK